MEHQDASRQEARVGSRNVAPAHRLGQGIAQTSTGQRKLERSDLRNRRRIEEKQGEEEAETAVEPAGVMRDRVRRKMRKMKI